MINSLHQELTNLSQSLRKRSTTERLDPSVVRYGHQIDQIVRDREEVVVTSPNGERREKTLYKVNGRRGCIRKDPQAYQYAEGKTRRNSKEDWTLETPMLKNVKRTEDAVSEINDFNEMRFCDGEMSCAARTGCLAKKFLD